MTFVSILWVGPTGYFYMGPTGYSYGSYRVFCMGPTGYFCMGPTGYFVWVLQGIRIGPKTKPPKITL
jgi:hypothetical protein